MAATACEASQPVTTTSPQPVVDEPLPGGELCEEENSTPLRLRFDPPKLVLAPGKERPVRLIVDPDLCSPFEVTYRTTSPAAAPPGSAKIDLRHPTHDFNLRGVSVGASSLIARMERVSPSNPDDKEIAEVELPIDVRDEAPPTCSPGEGKGGVNLGPGSLSAAGGGALASAALSVPAGAFSRTDEFALPPFAASIGCGKKADLVPDAGGDLAALGPAVAFEGSGPVTSSNVLRREIDFAIPVNPAALPSAARLRHLEVLYQGPRAKKPRTVAIANPRIEAFQGGGYVLRFSSPWLGTYQAVARKDAGAGRRTRRLMHRAIVGFSMGAGGTASFGSRHHDRFDAIAPLGGLSDYIWLSWFIEGNAMSGFCPASNPDCAKVAPNRYPMPEPFAHTMDWNHWWYEQGSGNGGSFPRHDYVQIFGDLSLAFGNLIGQNADPALVHMVAGPKKTDPWIVGNVTGLPPGVDCSFAVSPIGDDPDNAEQRRREQGCRKFRCDPKNAWTARTNYFDDEFNPDGSKPVISFCDGGQKGVSPYKNTWTSDAGDHTEPVNVALAVDLNGNGIRDENEPVIRSGHEPYDDCGLDGLCDPSEPGYDPVTNPDPNQDDYDYMLSPSGTEGNHHYELGERFRDDGFDGVPNTKDRHVAGDPGEGDGVYSEGQAWKRMRSADAHSIVRGWTDEIPGGPLTDPALGRFDIMTDGGVRDLFNFASVANHLAGAVGTRRTAAGRSLKSIAFYNGYEFLPGQDPARPQDFAPGDLRWKDIADMPNVRYGSVDATPQQILQGDGMHVGTAAQLLNRLLFGFYYVAARWPDADRTRTSLSIDQPAPSTINELGTKCELLGRCEKIFTGPKTKRTGPIAVTLPPGYSHEENVRRNTRYPVVFVLHGYGQDPRDLEATALVTNNFMNDGTRSSATRLPKFIVVYVDGRCRQQNGVPECIQGSFYVNSARQGGPQFDSWFEEVMEYIDKNYRTMPPSDVEIPE